MSFSRIAALMTGASGSGVPDARRAAVAHEVEPQRFQVRGEAGPVEVLGDDLGAGSEARLHVRRDAQAEVDRLAGRRPAAIMTAGLDVFVQLVIAAMTTEPSRRVSRSLRRDCTSAARVPGGRAPCPPVATSLWPLPALSCPAAAGARQGMFPRSPGRARARSRSRAARRSAPRKRPCSLQ